MTVAVLTDSSACLPPAVAERLGIVVVPITIRLEDAELHDDSLDAAERVYSALRDGAVVKSSAPSPAEYLAALERASAPDALIVTPAEEFTGMRRSASLAAQVASSAAGSRLDVVDSRTAAAAQGLIVLAAAERAARGGTLEEVRSAAADAIPRAELVATLEDMTHIRRSGRVPAFAIDLARRLGVRPVFRFRDGSVERIGVPRDERAALERVAREWAARGGPTADRSTVFHAQARDPAEALRSRLGDGDHPVTEFSPSMGIHTGPGVVGVAWLRRD